MIRFGAADRFLVTGASAGIGRACALDLHKRGATVLALARREHELVQLRDQSDAPERMIAVVRDLSTELETLPDMLAQLVARHGTMRGMVCAAGVLGNAPLRVLHLPFVRAVLEVNSVSTAVLLSAFAREGMASPAASVVLLSSVASIRGLSGATAYVASKGAIDALCRSAAAELGPLGYRVNAILPGVVQTPMTADVPSEQLAWMTNLQAIEGRIMPEDVAWLATFLLSDLARSITGESIAVDAGVGLSLKRHDGVTSMSSDYEVSPP